MTFAHCAHARVPDMDYVTMFSPATLLPSHGLRRNIAKISLW